MTNENLDDQTFAFLIKNLREECATTGTQRGAIDTLQDLAEFLKAPPVCTQGAGAGSLRINVTVAGNRVPLDTTSAASADWTWDDGGHLLANSVDGLKGMYAAGDASYVRIGAITLPGDGSWDADCVSEVLNEGVCIKELGWCIVDPIEKSFSCRAHGTVIVVDVPEILVHAYGNFTNPACK